MTDENKETPKASSKRTSGPQKVDRLAARVEGAEAVAEWARQTAVGAALVAGLVLLALVILVFRLRGALAPVAPVAAAVA